MSRSTKVHFYDHTLRSAAATGLSLCRDKAYFYLVPPKKAQTVENMYLHLKMTFDAAIPSGQRVLQYIGIGNEFPLFIENDPSGYFNKLDLNLAADPTTRKIDLRLNLTPLLKKTNAGWRDRTNIDGPNLTYVIIKTADGNRDINTVASVELCKVDALYTTTGIQ